MPGMTRQEMITDLSPAIRQALAFANYANPIVLRHEEDGDSFIIEARERDRVASIEVYCPQYVYEIAPMRNPLAISEAWSAENWIQAQKSHQEYVVRMRRYARELATRLVKMLREDDNG